VSGKPHVAAQRSRPAAGGSTSCAAATSLERENDVVRSKGQGNLPKPSTRILLQSGDPRPTNCAAELPLCRKGGSNRQRQLPLAHGYPWVRQRSRQVPAIASLQGSGVAVVPGVTQAIGQQRQLLGQPGSPSVEARQLVGAVAPQMLDHVLPAALKRARAGRHGPRRSHFAATPGCLRKSARSRPLAREATDGPAAPAPRQRRRACAGPA